MYRYCRYCIYVHHMDTQKYIMPYMCTGIHELRVLLYMYCTCMNQAVEHTYPHFVDLSDLDLFLWNDPGPSPLICSFLSPAPSSSSLTAPARKEF